MNKLRLSLCAIGAYLALVAAFGVLGSGPATGQKGSPPGPDVRVVNRTNEPVPVTLQGTGQFNGDVNVVNTPSVNVANTQPIAVLDAAAIAREPFQFSIQSASDTYTVPAGKRLVLLCVNGSIVMPTGGDYRPALAYVANLDDKKLIHLPTQFQGPDLGNPVYAGSEQVLMYYDAGETIKFAVGPVTPFRRYIQLTGYLESAD